MPAKRTNWDEALGAQEAGGAPPPEPPPPSDEASPLDKSAQQPLNDYGNGQRLVIHFGADLMFVPRIGWFAWNGKVWAQDFDGMGVRRVAHRIPKIIAEEATRSKYSARDAAILKAASEAEAAYEALLARPRAELAAEEMAEMLRLRELIDSSKKAKDRSAKQRGEHARFGKSSGNSSKITNMLQEAEPYAETRIDALNTDPMVVNCETATLRARRPCRVVGRPPRLARRGAAARPGPT
jgi:putative DNA primase/helicase